MFIRYHLPTMLWALFIMIICAIPGDKIPKLTFLEWLKPDKIVHLLVFSVLSIFIIRSLLDGQLSHLPIKKAGLMAVIISALYGALVEFLQYAVFINRSGDLRDAIANTIGAIIGWWIYKRFLSKNSDKLKA